MQRSVKNFTGSDAIQVHQGGNHNGIEPLVVLVQNNGSLSFQFSMTASQAEELAGVLIEFAVDADVRRKVAA